MRRTMAPCGVKRETSARVCSGGQGSRIPGKSTLVNLVPWPYTVLMALGSSMLYWPGASRKMGPRCGQGQSGLASQSPLGGGNAPYLLWSAWLVVSKSPRRTWARYHSRDSLAAKGPGTLPCDVKRQATRGATKTTAASATAR